MTPISPAVAELVADMLAHGIDFKADGAELRYRPKSRMTPALLERLQMLKAAMLANGIIQDAHERGDVDLAEAMAEAWGERVAISVEDGKQSQHAAELIALAQLQVMQKRARAAA